MARAVAEDVAEGRCRVLAIVMLATGVDAALVYYFWNIGTRTPTKRRPRRFGASA